MDTLLDGFLRLHPQLLTSPELGGVPRAGQALVLAALAQHYQHSLLCLVSTVHEAERLHDDLTVFLPHPGPLTSSDVVHSSPYPLLFPEIEMSIFDEGLSDPERVHVLNDLAAGQPVVVIAPLLAFLQHAASTDKLQRKMLKKGDSLDRALLLEWLEKSAYRRVSLVELPGQFSANGSNVDVYPANGLPKRIELADGKIADLRAFDVEDQLSRDPLESISLLSMREPRREAGLGAALPAETRIVLLEEADLRRQLTSMARAVEAGWRYSNYDDVEILQNDRPDDWEEVQEMLGQRSITRVSAEPVSYDLAISAVAQVPLAELPAWAKAEGEALYVVSNHARRVRSLLTRRGLSQVKVIKGLLSEGFKAPGFAEVLTDWELFGTARRLRYEAKTRNSADSLSFGEGELCVHSEHGIGRFLGLVPVELEGARRDLLKFMYANEQTLLVPPEQIAQITPYRGSEDKEPALSRLDRSNWPKTLLRVEAAARATAAALRKLQEQRAARQAAALGGDTPELEELEASFPFDETPAQLQAIEEIKRDLEKPLAMDRLLCGDVGYGKTEVAMRACFKAIQAGFQAAILVPTTVLAQQHFEKFSDRLEPFRVKIAGLWGTAGETTEMVEALRDGSLPLVIGTHRLLSEDVSFAKLGLLVVDEEQQFGVGHKERLRQLAENVHTLSMSATPIPRTMQLSLAGIRQVSLLDVPPLARRPVRTYLLVEENKLIAAAVMRELERGGQVFILHNKVADLEKLGQALRKLLGKARIAIAHGQLAGGELEQVLADFGERRYDVLLCSTIIESGIDMPNVNTIIIKDAHMFGLGQLYQIRGRVGRSDRQAYCYLMTPKWEKLSEKARQRLDTIRTLTELGSGFQVAVRDLEIRGAGDLIGGDQSGQIARVGYHLYAQLLQKQLHPGEDEVVKARCVINLPLDACLPTDYISDSATRIGIYRRLAEMKKLSRLTEELRDRFGPLPMAVQNLLDLTRLRRLAAAAGIVSIEYEERFGEASILCRGAGEPQVFGPVARGNRLLDFVLERLQQPVAV